MSPLVPRAQAPSAQLAVAPGHSPCSPVHPPVEVHSSRDGICGRGYVVVKSSNHIMEHL